MAQPCGLYEKYHGDYDPNQKYDENCNKIFDNQNTFLDFSTSSLFIALLLLCLVLITIAFAFKHPNGKTYKILKSIFTSTTGNINSILLAVSAIFILLPVFLPNQYILAASIEYGSSYWSAVSLSSFLGIRYGVYICAGFLLLGLSIFRFYKK